MTTADSAVTTTAARHLVVRSTRASQISTVIAIVGALVLFSVPTVFTTGTVQKLTTLFIYVILAVMWNALAGYGGMVSVGQQAFIGFGAYGTVWLTQHGFTPFPAMMLATVASGVLSAFVALIVLHLKGGQFAIGTWVIAEAFGLLVLLNAALGAGTGTSLRGLNVYDPANRAAYIYWFTLGFLVLLLVMLFFLLRLKTGAALQAIRDDEEAAASLGVRVTPIKFGIYVLAGFGSGGAGALILAHTIFITPTSIFGVQWSAIMIFMVLIGGLGTFEGPIVGALIYFIVQDQFSDFQTFYFIGLGVVAILFALFLPRGLWSLVADRLPAQMPVGYLLRPITRRRATEDA